MSFDLQSGLFGSKQFGTNQQFGAGGKNPFQAGFKPPATGVQFGASKHASGLEALPKDHVVERGGGSMKEFMGGIGNMNLNRPSAPTSLGIGNKLDVSV